MIKLNDPIKEILRLGGFNAFVWDDLNGISVSWKNKMIKFDSIDELREINEITNALLKAR